MTQSLVRGAISSRILERADLLFNNSFESIIYELLQNARRAGATLVKIDLNSATFSIEDNGKGIANFQNLLTLGDSQWENDTQSKEDPAGMGFFSLAQYGAVVRSLGKKICVTKDVFLGRTDAVVNDDPEPIQGTRVEFSILPALKHNGISRLQEQINAVCRFYPVKVIGTVYGEYNLLFLDQCEPILKDILPGVNVGLFYDKPTYGECVGYLNFYGLVVTRDTLPPVTSCFKKPIVWAKADVVSSTDLKLTLPDRSSVVKNDAWATLQKEVKRQQYLFLAEKTCHYLNYNSYCEAIDLGVKIKEAARELDLFCFGDGAENKKESSLLQESRTCRPKPLGTNAVRASYTLGNCDRGLLDFAAFFNKQYEIFEENPGYENYEWYDILPVIDSVRCHWTPGSKPGFASDISLSVTIRDANGKDTSTEEWSMPFGFSSFSDLVLLESRFAGLLTSQQVNDEIGTGDYFELSTFVAEALNDRDRYGNDEDDNSYSSEVASDTRHIENLIKKILLGEKAVNRRDARQEIEQFFSYVPKNGPVYSKVTATLVGTKYHLEFEELA